MINKSSKIFIAGHNGLVGNAVFRKLKSERYKKLIFANRKKLDLLDLKKVEKFFALKKPDFLIVSFYYRLQVVPCFICSF